MRSKTAIYVRTLLSSTGSAFEWNAALRAFQSTLFHQNRPFQPWRLEKLWMRHFLRLH